MALAPKVLDRINGETVKRDFAIYSAGIEKTLQDGWGPWEIAGPKHRLAGYMGCTWPEDIQLILNPDYIAGWHAGVYPPLRALTEWQKITTPQPDGKGGTIVPQPSDYRPYVWALWLICGPRIFNHFAADFRHLLDAQRNREVAA